MMNARVLTWGVVVLALVGIGAWAGLRRERKNPIPKNVPLVVTTLVKQEDLPITIMATGNVAAKNATPVIPEISGRVAWVIDNGVLIKAGEDVLRLDPRKQEEQVADLTTRLKDAQIRQGQSESVSGSRMKEMNMRLQQAENGVTAYERQQDIQLRQEEDQIKFDENELVKSREELEVQRRLADKGLVPQTDVDRQSAGVDAKTYALKKAKSDLELKRKQVDAEKGQRRQQVNNTNRDMSRARNWTARDVRMSGNEVENLTLQLARAKEDLTRTVLKSPANGLVMLSSLGGWIGNSEPPKIGDYVSQGREVAKIIDIDRMQVQIELDQTQVTGVKMGQAVEVTIEALPGKILNGKVSSIGQNARRAPVKGWFGNSSTATFPVTIDLPPTGTALIRPGMRANIRIVAETIKQAMLVPLSCVFQYDGKPVVYVEHGGMFIRTPVIPGQNNGDYVAITQGLQAGQRIALNDLGTSPGGESQVAPSKESRSK